MIKKTFIRGLLTITPVALTFALAYWIFSMLERSFKVPLEGLVGEYYFPGLGVLVALVLIFFVGVVINNWIIQKIYGWGESLVRKIPFIKTLYNATSDLMQFFKKDHREKLDHVVMVEFNGWRVIGFVTRETFEDLPGDVVKEEEVAVYIPFSYQIGGFTFFIPNSKLTKLSMSVDHAMRFIITAGILKDHKVEKNSDQPS